MRQLGYAHLAEVIEKRAMDEMKHAENRAIKAYNDAIKLAVEVGDNGTRDMLESILKDEEDHIDWIEAQLNQIKQMGI